MMKQPVMRTMSGGGHVCRGGCTCRQKPAAPAKPNTRQAKVDAILASPAGHHLEAELHAMTDAQLTALAADAIIAANPPTAWTAPGAGDGQRPTFRDHLLNPPDAWNLGGGAA